MSLILYTNPMSRGRIVRWMLEEVGAAYDTELLDYASSMKDAGFLAINPMGKVPAIVHDGHVVTETAAICAYLADAFPGAGLAPAVDDRADYYRWLFFAAGPLEHAITNRSMGFAPSVEQRPMAGYGHYELTIDTLEAALSGRDYVTGAFGAADVYLGAQVGWGLRFGTLPERAAFVDYWKRLEQRPAWTRASAIDDALMPAPTG